MTAHTPTAVIAIARRDSTVVNDRTVVALLRLEGLAAFVAGLALYGAHGGSWLVVLPLLLVPDVSMVGYLRDPRLGALLYNLAHTWLIGLVVLGAGLATGAGWVVLAGTILIAHVGMDRALGYGLKLPTSFQETHLGRIGRRADRAGGRP